jgi:tetratricopeptide (TPR) repeat protein
VVLLSVLIASAGAPAARAQAPAAAVSSKAAELTIEQQNALGVLDSLADQAKGIDDEAVRIRVEARVADVMWDRDRERAKRLYRRVFDEIDDLNESLVDPGSAPVGARQELRVEMFASLFRLDPAFATQLARSLDDDPEMYDGEGLPFDNLSDRSSTLLRVATSLAPRNPQLAVELGRQCLEGGVPVEFSSLLLALGSSSPQLADALADEAARAALQSAQGPLEMWGVAAYLFPDLRIDDSGDDAGVASGPDLKRRFLEAAYAVTGRYVAALGEHAAGANPDPSAPVDPSSVYVGQGLMMTYGFARQLAPMFDAYDPERATAFRVLVGQIEGSAPADVRDRIGVTSGTSDSPNAIAARASEATDPSLRAALYARAAALAMHRDGYDAAKGYVAKIEDPDERARVLAPLAREAAAAAAQERRYDDARRIAGDIVDLDERAAVYCELARSLIAANKRQPALDLLDDAQRILLKEGAVMTETKARALVRVANLYAAIDALRGFDVMRTAVDAVNKGLSLPADAAKAGRNPALLFRLSEFDASQGLEELARTDYFRALALAQGIEAHPLSILAQIGVIRGAMRPLPNPKAPPAAEKPKPKPKKVEPAKPVPAPAAL